jgi:predicted ATPase/DNA-binding NarL/FixJ family response regulator
MTSDLVTATGNLPAEPNSFVGRERDLADLVEILERARALTLCGPGGIGKTRLALRLAAMLAARQPHGAWIADLADVELDENAAGEAGQLLAAVTAALGIRQEADRLLADTLIEALRSRTMLLILDTCEHLVQECAELVQRLLAGCPGLRVIATSREPLGVRGEVIWRVPPLGLPPAPPSDLTGSLDASELARSEAIQLFVERAAAVRPGFGLTEVNARAVAQICRTLDGLPLAIELAAARVRALSPEQIADRLAGRFELLALGDRAAPPRQQTLRATVAWSYELLAPAERLLLSRLSVFHGWNLEMAERVCADGPISPGAVLDLLRALIDKSLVSLDGELSGDARYRLLDTVRELAAEQAAFAGEVEGLRVTHRDCMLGIAEDIAAVAFVRGEPRWLERVALYHRVRADRANFNLALACCAQRGDAEEGLRLCRALSGYWLASGEVAEGAGWLDRLLATHSAVPRGVTARALSVRAEIAFEQQDYAGAARHARACLELSEGIDDGNPAGGFRLLALTELMDGRSAEALAHAEAGVAAARRMADDWELGMGLAVRAGVIATQGDLAEAENVFQQALEVLSDNNGWGVANVLYGLGQVASTRSDVASATRYLRQALALYRQIDARPEMARCLAAMGQIALSQGELAEAAACMTESIQLSLATGHRLAIARALRAMAALASASGDVEQAVRLAGAARAAARAITTQQSAAAERRLGGLIDAARVALGPDAVTALLAQGEAMSPHEAVKLVIGPSARQPAAIRASGCKPRAEGPLSDRELEIATLAARGLSNRAIAGELFIAQTTVARHIANIFGKLGLSSRAQLAAWMIDRGVPGGRRPGPAQRGVGPGGRPPA